MVMMSITEAQKQQQQKRNCCCQVHFGPKMLIVKVSLQELHLSSNEVMLKPSRGWTYMQGVQVCLCTEISDRGSEGFALDT